MGLKLFYDKLEDVPEGIRDLYVVKDGKAVLDVEGGVEDVSGLKSALGRIKNEATTLKEMVKKFKDLGIEDPDKVAADLTELAELRKIDPKTEAGKIVDARIKQLTAELNLQHEKALAAERANTEKYRANFEEREITGAALQAIAENKGKPKLLLNLIKSVARIREGENGKPRTEILDQDGNPRFNRNGDYMTIPELVAEMKNDAELSAAFDATNKQGSGHHQGGSGSSQGNANNGRPGERLVISPEDARSGKFIDQLAKVQATVQEPKK